MITLYTLPTCGICKVIKTKLERKNISFVESQEVEQLVKEKGIEHFPVLMLEDKTILNSPKEINNWINNQ